MQVTIQMNFERSTKNKHRYTAADESAAVSEVYVAKSYMLAPLPTIKVTISTGGENAHGQSQP